MIELFYPLFLAECTKMGMLNNCNRNAPITYIHPVATIFTLTIIFASATTTLVSASTTGNTTTSVGGEQEAVSNTTTTPPPTTTIQVPFWAVVHKCGI